MEHDTAHRLNRSANIVLATLLHSCAINVFLLFFYCAARHRRDVKKFIEPDKDLK